MNIMTFLIWTFYEVIRWLTIIQIFKNLLLHQNRMLQPILYTFL